MIVGCSLVINKDDVAEENNVSWRDLPSAFLCHILAIIPYKRADVKSVCRAWRAAVNSSFNDVRLPAADVPLLCQLPNIKHLTVTGAASSPKSCNNHQQKERRHQSANTWPPSLSCLGSAAAPGARTRNKAAGAAEAAEAAEASANDVPGISDCWAAVHPQLLNRLHTLRLAQCPVVVQQLARGLWQSVMNGSRRRSCSSSSNTVNKSWLAPVPAFTDLQVLDLEAVGDVGLLLAALHKHCTATPLNPLVGATAAATASGSQTAGAALGCLRELHLVQCSLGSCDAGGCSCQPLQLLPLLPSLQVIQLSGCPSLHQLPTAVLECAGLTKLLLANNEQLTDMPGGCDQLTALKVLDLSCNARLHSLGPNFSLLTSLTELNLSGPSGLWADYSSVAGSCNNATSAGKGAYGTAADGSGRSTGIPTCCLKMGKNSSAAAARAALPQLLLPALPHQQQHALLPELASLRRLRRLVLSNNRHIMVLPKSLSILTGLTRLDVRGCGIRWLGDDVLECSGLQELLLGDNVLVEVPDDISRLQQLRVLDVGGCSSLWRLPGTLLQLSNLERLVVPSKAIGQHVIEQLECGQQPVQVDMEPGDGDADDWRYGGAEVVSISDDDSQEWSSSSDASHTDDSE